MRASGGLLLLILAASPAVAYESNAFAASVEGWSVVNYPFRSHVASPATSGAVFDAGFGNPAGSVRVGDVWPETGVAAPAQYLGDKSAYYGGTFSYDILVRFTDGVTYPAVVLNGGTMSVYFDTPSPPLGAWDARTIPLTEAGWKVSGVQSAATQAQFQAVLANLQGLYVYTEWRTGPDDTSFDNPSLVAPPAIPAVGGAGLALLGALLLMATRVRVVARPAGHPSAIA